MALFSCLTYRFRWNRICLYQSNKIFRNNYRLYLCRIGLWLQAKCLSFRLNTPRNLIWWFCLCPTRTDRRQDRRQAKRKLDCTCNRLTSRIRSPLNVPLNKTIIKCFRSFHVFAKMNIKILFTYLCYDVALCVVRDIYINRLPLFTEQKKKRIC